jgi:hypothetical protein
MPRNITVYFSDGTAHQYNNAPDVLTPDDIEKRTKKDYPNKKITRIDGGKKNSDDSKGSANIEKTPSIFWKGNFLVKHNEPNTKYYITNIEKNKNFLIVSVRREGSSGISTTIRAINVEDETWKYLDDNGTKVTNSNWSGFVRGSSAHSIFTNAVKLMSNKK